MVSREDVLQKAISTVCVDRERQYGNPEDNFVLIARLWGEYLDITVRAKDVAAMMILLKIARVKTGGFNFDNYVDIAGYAACGGAVDSSDGAENFFATAAPPEEPCEDEDMDEDDRKTVEAVDKFMEKIEIRPVRKRGGGKRPLDDGKIGALRRAGWSLAKIADEMGCSAQTVANRLAKMEAGNENSEKEEAEDVGAEEFGHCED